MSRASPQWVYKHLFQAYGTQQWWPADTPFEMMVGAILTQNTNWNNVEKAINNLKAENMLDEISICQCSHTKLARIIRPSGFYNQKAERLQRFAQFYIEHGKREGLIRQRHLRELLLSLSGIGPETADSMLLYAFEHPVFVIDAYTQRIFHRLGLLNKGLNYKTVQSYFHQQLPTQLTLYQEFHALIVEHAKRYCRAKPLCHSCPLNERCIQFNTP